MKKIAVVLLVLSVIICPVFSADVDGNVSDSTLGGSSGIDLAIISRALTLILGVVGGGFVTVKFAMDLVHALMMQEQDPAGVRKCLIRFILAVFLIAGFFVFRSFIIGTSGNRAASSKTDNTQQVFIQVLSVKGAEVETEYQRTLDLLNLQ